jgi:hypothetical protein
VFYTYYQNNSGGYWIFEPKAGISHYVIVEANSGEDADAKAEDIGLYFDGCDSGNDCSCCGDRWSRQYKSGKERPEIYGQESVESDKDDDVAEVYIHYLDGRVVQSTNPDKHAWFKNAFRLSRV